MTVVPHAQTYVLRIKVGGGTAVYVDTAVAVPAGNDLHALTVGHQIAATMMGALTALGASTAEPVSVEIEGYGSHVPHRSQT